MNPIVITINKQSAIKYNGIFYGCGSNESKCDVRIVGSRPM